jgi:3-hydroxybutyrate dehydrogenase
MSVDADAHPRTPGASPDLRERTAVVTGAASGIGRACAAHLAAAGARVVVVDRDEKGAHTVAAEIGGIPLVVDLGDPAALDRLDCDGPDGLTVAGADILVNNAGIQHVAPVPDFPPETFALILRVMVEAPFRLARRVLPGMYARGWGRLVHVSSVHGHRASAFKSAYVTAKHGLEGLSKVLALEGADRGVTSNTVCPGYVRTPLVEGQLTAQAKAHGIEESAVLDEVLLTRTPVKRLVEPAEVAAMVGYLCGPGTASVTGASFPLDGGWTAT